MAVSQRRSGGAAALVAAAVLLLLGLSDHVVEAKKVKRVKAGTTYKTHDRKLTISEKNLGTVYPRRSKQGTNNRSGGMLCAWLWLGSWHARGHGVILRYGHAITLLVVDGREVQLVEKMRTTRKVILVLRGGGPVGLVGRRVAHNCTHGDQHEIPQ